MSVIYTADQQKAIDTRRCNLLVSAAAGSGKTAVLVERIINIITDEKELVDIDRLLVVTFTEAAAAEMRQRIQEAIAQKLDQDPLNEHLRKQAVLINKAPISTIHSFCNSVIKQNFYAVGIDPSYKIAELTESYILQEEAMEEVFTAEYKKEENSHFYNLIEIYSDRFLDDKLRELIMTIYHFASNSPEPEKWLLENCRRFALENNFMLEDTIWGRFIQDNILVSLNGALNACKNAINICSMQGGPILYINCLKDDLNLIEELINACNHSFDIMYEKFSNIKFSRLPTIKASEETNEMLKDVVKEIRDKQIKYVINGISTKIFFKPPKLFKEDLIQLYPYINKLCDLVIEFKQVYQKKKTENNLLDFNDLEHFCLAILNAKNGEIAQSYKEKYYEVFIDEYQDSNMVQEMILYKVSNAHNRFMVGDIKQSIYKFRRARPEIFIEKYNYYAYEGQNIKIDLSKNFRSRREIIQTVNFFFKQLMSREIGDVAYSHSEELYYGSDYPVNNETNLDTEIYLIDCAETENEAVEEAIEELNNAELEGKLIAHRIYELTNDEKNKVYDRKLGFYRKIRYSDIAILLRSVKNADTIITELNKFNIPAYSETSTDFFKNIEIMIFHSILKIIDNPLQDIELLGVLHSPIYRFTADELITLRNYGKNKYFYHCLQMADEDKNVHNALKEKIRYFNTHINKWRQQASFTKVSDLMDMILRDTEYLYHLSVSENSEMKKGNLRIFKELAVNFEKGSLRGLYNFIKYLDKIAAKSGPIGNAKSIAENDNTVKIMSIHKSKGLEFPFVFVSMLGAKFNKADERQDIILHQDYGFGPKYTDLKMRIKKDTFAHMSLAEKTKAENYSEEIRILYVALTRAKEKLILTGCTKDALKNISKWAQVLIGAEDKLPSGYMLSCTRTLDWIMPAVLRHQNALPILKLTGMETFITKGEFYNYKIPFTLNVIKASVVLSYAAEHSPLPDVASFQYEHRCSDALFESIDKKLSWTYPYKQDTLMPSKVLISEVKRNYISQGKFDSEAVHLNILTPIFKAPDFLKKERPLTPAEKGTAVHTLMEHLNVLVHQDSNAVISLIKTLIEKNILSTKEAAAIPVNKILNFVHSEVGRRILHAEEIKKETPFVMEMAASEAFIKNASSESNVLIHGIIDCFFKEADGYVLLDYKTDFATKENIEEIKQRYAIQMKIYKNAIEKSFGVYVKECILYLFYIDNYIIIDI